MSQGPAHTTTGAEGASVPACPSPEFLYTREQFTRPQGHRHPDWNKFPSFRTPEGLFPGALKATPSMDS